MKLIFGALAAIILWLMSGFHSAPVPSCQTTTLDPSGYGMYNDCYTGK